MVIAARQKHNTAHLSGSLLFATIAGVMAGSWPGFVAALALSLAGAAYAGEIRPTPRRRARRGR
jgi:hypothetical protein